MNYHKQLTTNKFIEIETDTLEKTNYSLRLYVTTKDDHAGFNLIIEFYKFAFNFHLYDHRHWNYDDDCWKVYTEKQERSDEDYEDAKEALLAAEQAMKSGEEPISLEDVKKELGIN